MSMVFYTPDGKEWSRFEGILPDEKYQEIYTMLKTYIPEYEEPELYPEEMPETEEENDYGF